MSNLDHPTLAEQSRPVRLGAEPRIPRSLRPLRAAWPLPQYELPVLAWPRPVADWVCWATALDFIQPPETPPASPREPVLPAWARPLAAARQLRDLARDGTTGAWTLGRLVRLQMLLSPATPAVVRQRSTPVDGTQRLAPLPDLLPALLDDLCAFLDWRAPDPLAQAALVHDQCLAIQPFEDGNRRLARVLAATVAQRGGIPAEALFPLFALAGRGRLAGDASRGGAATASRADAWHEGLCRGAAFAGVLRNAIDEWTWRLAARLGGETRALRLAEVASARPVLDAAVLRGVAGATIDAQHAYWQCLRDEGWSRIAGDPDGPPWLAGTRFWQRAAALWALAADAGRPATVSLHPALAMRE
jgi:hypothetical protein